MQWHQETNMRLALSHKLKCLPNLCVFHRRTCWWPTQPPSGIAHTPEFFFRQLRQRPAGAGCLVRSRISAAKSNLDVPAVTSVEGRILTVHYLRRNEDVQVRQRVVSGRHENKGNRVFCPCTAVMEPLP